jgi:hypothetical protein
LLFFTVLGLGIALTTAVSVFATGHGHHGAWRMVAFAVTVILNSALFLVVFRVLTPRSIAATDLWLGAVLGGVGTPSCSHRHRASSNCVTQALYGQFALVLGLMGWPPCVGARRTRRGQRRAGAILAAASVTAAHRGRRAGAAGSAGKRNGAGERAASAEPDGRRSRGRRE